MSYDMHDGPAIMMQVEATAYVKGGATATGADANKCTGVAVDPSVIPYGSILYIPQIGMRVADDCGAVHGHIIDIRMGSRDECIKWGRRTLNIRVLTGRREHNEPASRAKEARQNEKPMDSSNLSNQRGTAEAWHKDVSLYRPSIQDGTGSGAHRWGDRGWQASLDSNAIDAGTKASNLAHSALLGALLGLAVGGGIIIGIIWRA